MNSINLKLETTIAIIISDKKDAERIFFSHLRRQECLSETAPKQRLQVQTDQIHRLLNDFALQ